MIGEAELRALAAGRWTAPLLALLHEERGARFARLLAALGLPRDSLARTLAQAQEAGWIARNPGHGHPLRPDYLLTAKGEGLGAIASRVMEARRRLGLASDSLPRWSLPIVGRLEPGWARFGALRDALAPVTPRALSLNLQQMIAGDIVLRRVEPDFPPTPLYGLAPAGRALAESLAV